MAAPPTHPGLQRAEYVANLLDEAVKLPVVGGVGLDPILGLLPVAGDTVSAVLSLYVVVEAWLAGVPRQTLARMLLNVGLDWGVGSLPVLGSAFDLVFRANRRNFRLFRQHLETDA